jgi:integrase-like protein
MGQSPFLDQVRRAIFVRHYSIHTEQSYIYWIKRFILFHDKQHSSTLGEAEVAQFLGFLAIAATKQASAFSGNTYGCFNPGLRSSFF